MSQPPFSHFKQHLQQRQHELLKKYSSRCQITFTSHWGRRTVPEHAQGDPPSLRRCKCKCASSSTAAAAAAHAYVTSSTSTGASRCLTMRQSDVHPSLMGVFIDPRCHSNGLPSLAADDFVCNYANGGSGFIFTLSEFNSMPFAAHTAFTLPTCKQKFPDIYVVVADPTSIPANINHQSKNISSCKFSSCASKVSKVNVRIVS